MRDLNTDVAENIAQLLRLRTKEINQTSLEYVICYFFCSTYNSNQLEYSISRFQIFHVKANGKAISFSFNDARWWGRLWMWMHDDSVWTAWWSWRCLFWSEKSRHLWNLLWVHTMSWMIQFREQYVSRLKFDKERIWVILCMFLSQSSERYEDVTQWRRSEFFHEWTSIFKNIIHTLEDSTHRMYGKMTFSWK